MEKAIWLRNFEIWGFIKLYKENDIILDLDLGHMIYKFFETNEYIKIILQLVEIWYDEFYIYK